MPDTDEPVETETDGSGEAAGVVESVEADVDDAEEAGDTADETGTAAEEPTGREQLEAAIEENPEAVAEFVDRLDAVNELLDVMALGEEAMTDEMVVELAGTGSSLGELADTAAAPDTRDGLARMLSAVGSAEQAEVESTSTLALLRSLRDDEVKQGMAYLVAVARAIGAGADDGPEGN
jgi:uncharacterized protein YjgD (DUF1641 family)